MSGCNASGWPARCLCAVLQCPSALACTSMHCHQRGLKAECLLCALPEARRTSMGRGCCLRSQCRQQRASLQSTHTARIAHSYICMCCAQLIFIGPIGKSYTPQGGNVSPTLVRALLKTHACPAQTLRCPMIPSAWPETHDMAFLTVPRLCPAAEHAPALPYACGALRKNCP